LIDTLDIYLTGKCNLKCGYCYGENTKYSHMSLEEYKKVLDFAVETKVKTIELCGGEPLISPYFRDIVSLTKEYKFDLIRNKIKL